MIETPQEHQAYLVRIWPVRNMEGDEVIWRASITNARTSESRGFASLDELFDHLRAQAGQKYKPIDEKGGDIET
jgi:hypothetical protein